MFLDKKIEAKIERIPESGCWIWIGPLHHTGYGNFNENGKRTRAHREIFQRLVGSIPKGKFLCHKCDIRSCVNPNHMFIGSHQDNMNDMVNKKRSLFGSKHHNSKLTEHDVHLIKHFYALDPYSSIAARFGVSESLIKQIKTNRGWNHVS